MFFVRRIVPSQIQGNLKKLRSRAFGIIFRFAVCIDGPATATSRFGPTRLVRPPLAPGLFVARCPGLRRMGGFCLLFPTHKSLRSYLLRLRSYNFGKSGNFRKNGADPFDPLILRQLKIVCAILKGSSRPFRNMFTFDSSFDNNRFGILTKWQKNPGQRLTG